jgi:hypothetical protein
MGSTRTQFWLSITIACAGLGRSLHRNSQSRYRFVFLFFKRKSDLFFIAGERVYALKCDAQTLAVAWHPKAQVLAYVQDDDSGSVCLFGMLD